MGLSEKKDNLADAQVSVEGFVDDLLKRATVGRASDVHVEPRESGDLRFRFRIDGILHDQDIASVLDAEKFSIRVKVLSGLDMTVRDIPQEGHFVFYSQDGIQQAQMVDVRVSIFPTVYGEAIVLRLLNRAAALLKFGEIGIEPGVYQAAKELIRRPHGIVLITGPVNSGKTTTLYSILQEINSEDRNIVTLEDPVENHMYNIRQSQVSPARGYTFTRGLRSILRQDPDVIMVGEIRDPDTAEIAIRASLTGRLVLSTLHTNTAVGTIARLIDMGVEHWLVAYSLNGIITQRLVGKICDKCTVQYQPDEGAMRELGVTTEPGEVFYKGEGCETCSGTGFYGRIGIFEILELSDDFRGLILSRAPSSELRAKAVEGGMRFLKDDGIDKVRAGLTTFEEIMRVAV